MLKLRGPFTGIPSLTALDEGYMDLALVTASGPYRGPDGVATTALPVPFLTPARVREVAGLVLTSGDKELRKQAEKQCEQQLRELLQQLQADVVEVVAQVQQKHPQLAAARCSQAAAGLRIPLGAVRGRQLQARTIAALVVCLTGHQPLATASLMCDVCLASTRPAMAAQQAEVRQLLCMEGSLPVEQVEAAAAYERGGQLLADTQVLLDKHVPSEIAERFGLLEVPAWLYSTFTGQSGKRPRAANVAAFAWSVGERLSFAAAAALVPGSTLNGAKSCALPTSRVVWLRAQMLPQRDPSAAAAALRQHGAVAAAAAAAHPEEEQGAVVGWVEEAVEAGCSVLPGLVRRGLLSQEEAAAVVAALAALPVPAAFVAYASRGAGRKRAAPETYAATVLHLRLPRIAGGKAAVAFGLSRVTVIKGLNPNFGGGAGVGAGGGGAAGGAAAAGAGAPACRRRRRRRRRQQGAAPRAAGVGGSAGSRRAWLLRLLQAAGAGRRRPSWRLCSLMHFNCNLIHTSVQSSDAAHLCNLAMLLTCAIRQRRR